jgi:hypothetical protein
MSTELEGIASKLLGEAMASLKMLDADRVSAIRQVIAEIGKAEYDLRTGLEAVRRARADAMTAIDDADANEEAVMLGYQQDVARITTALAAMVPKT